MTTTQRSMEVAELGTKSKDELLVLAPEVGLSDGPALDNLRREDLLSRVLHAASAQQSLVSSGILDVMDEGYGFLRQISSPRGTGDVYISQSQIRRFGLKTGDTVTGQVRPPKEGERYFGLVRVEKINGMESDQVNSRARTQFEHLTPIFPEVQIKLETGGEDLATRMVDLFAPIGLGQRGLIVSPPKAGKTTMLKQIAQGVAINCPNAILMVVLIGERPEEVTDMRRWMQRGEVVGSTFDRPSDEHTHLAEVTIERAKRMVEYGEDVVIVLDGITRLSRAYNLAVGPGTGRIMSGGLDTGALYPPKRFFGAARNVEEGGSLTILATALVDTGSKMDEVIFEEFKGTGNMELRLDRRISERRIYPAIDVNASSTRHEELLFERKQLNQVWKLRRVLNGLGNDGDAGAAAGLELLIDRLKTFNNNDEFLVEIAKGPSMGA